MLTEFSADDMKWAHDALNGVESESPTDEQTTEPETEQVETIEEPTQETGQPEPDETTSDKKVEGSEPRIPKRRLDREIAKRRELERKLQEYESRTQQKPQDDTWELLDRYAQPEQQSQQGQVDPRDERLNRLEIQLLQRSLVEETRDALQDYPDVPEQAVYAIIAQDPRLSVDDAIDAYNRARKLFAGTDQPKAKPKPAAAPPMPRKGGSAQAPSQIKTKPPETLEEAREMLLREWDSGALRFR